MRERWCDRRSDDGPPLSAVRDDRKEHQQQRAVADHRLHRVARREALTKAVTMGSSTAGRGRPTATLTMVSTRPSTQACHDQEGRQPSTRGGAIQATGRPTAKNRKMGLPRNEMLLEHRGCTAAVVMDEIVEPLGDRSSSKRFSGPCVATWWSSNPNGTPTRREGQREQQHPTSYRLSGPSLAGEAFL